MCRSIVGSSEEKQNRKPTPAILQRVTSIKIVVPSLAIGLHCLVIFVYLNTYSDFVWHLFTFYSHQSCHAELDMKRASKLIGEELHEGPRIGEKKTKQKFNSKKTAAQTKDGCNPSHERGYPMALLFLIFFFSNPLPPPPHCRKSFDSGH